MCFSCKTPKAEDAGYYQQHLQQQLQLLQQQQQQEQQQQRLDVAATIDRIHTSVGTTDPDLDKSLRTLYVDGLNANPSSEQLHAFLEQNG